MKPLILTFKAFDSTVGSENITYQWLGNQVQGYQFKIALDTNTNTIVYKNFTSETELSGDRNNFFVIPKNVLHNTTNNTDYVYRMWFRVAYFGDVDEQIEFSDWVETTFRCYPTPNVKFGGVLNTETGSQVVRNSTLEVKIDYPDNAVETLDRFVVSYYDNDSNQLIAKSDSFYGEDNSYIITGLLENKKYRIVVSVFTTHELTITLEKVVLVRFRNKNTGISVSAESNKNKGYIEVTSYINANSYKFEYPVNENDLINNSSWINLLDNMLTYTNSSGLMTDCSICFVVRNIKPNSLIARFTDADDSDYIEVWCKREEYENYGEIEYDGDYPLPRRSIGKIYSNPWIELKYGKYTTVKKKSLRLTDTLKVILRKDENNNLKVEVE